MTREVRVASVSKFLLDQEKFLSKAEISYAKVLMKWLPYDKIYVNPDHFFDHLRAKNLKAHKQHASFVLDIFESCGTSYRKVTSTFVISLESFVHISVSRSIFLLAVNKDAFNLGVSFTEDSDKKD